MEGIVRAPELEDRVRWFRDRVAEERLTIDPTSFAGVALPAMERLAREHFAGPGLSPAEQLELTGRFNSFNQLLVMIRGAWGVAEKELRPRLREFVKGPFELSSTGTDTAARNKASETLFGCLASRVDPSFYFDEKPDVRFRFRDQHWGAACKTAYSKKSRQTVKEIVEGVKQVERANCDLGLVVVNVTPQIPHEKWQFVEDDRTFTFATVKEANQALRHEVERWVDSIPTHDLYRRLTQDKHGRPRNRVRCVVFMGLSHAYVRAHDRAVVLVPLTVTYPDNAFREVDGPEVELVPALFEQRNELARAARFIKV